MLSWIYGWPFLIASVETFKLVESWVVPPMAPTDILEFTDCLELQILIALSTVRWTFCRGYICKNISNDLVSQHSFDRWNGFLQFVDLHYRCGGRARWSAAYGREATQLNQSVLYACDAWSWSICTPHHQSLGQRSSKENDEWMSNGFEGSYCIHRNVEFCTYFCILLQFEGL